ncbi:MAG TPA: hypothetical protein VMT24_05725 [Aggregatilineaceae bacterium]|nr:hypothetical protein [Aggregatilineaceae bacterium]
MQALRTPQQAVAEDIFFGQAAIIWARWFLILAGVVLVLWNSTESNQLVIAILPILALTAMNFYLHGRYLVQRPANQALLGMTSLLDLGIITAIILLWQPRGLVNAFFTFYYPVVLATAFVFPRRVTIFYTLLTLIAYTVACVFTDPSLLSHVGWQKVLLERLITIAAMGGLGTYYWRIQRERRSVAMKGQE